MAAIDPVAYVRSIQPFRDLSPELFAEVAASLEISFHKAGSRIAQAGKAPLQHLYVIRKGVFRLDSQGRTLQVLEEGETFGYTSLLTNVATVDVVAEEDALTYRIPGAVFRKLLEDGRFASHFAVGVTERLRGSLVQPAATPFQPDLAVRVDRLARRDPVWIEEAATVGEAAAVMARERISSVLVRSEPPGILTDRDLRKRVLGAGLGPETPVARVMSRPLRTVPGETPLYDAWAMLLDARLHHLPVTRDGAIAGILTSTDILRSTSQGPVAVLRSVERLESRASLPGYAARLTAMVSSLLAGGLDAVVIAGLVARLNDALLRPILRWAEADLGPPPAPYAWIVFGSEGRMEQTLLTDQDNALVHADEGAAQADWYRALAERVNADLEAAGFPPCPGGYMARNWRGPISEWIQRFEGWIEVPTPKALLVASIFFDWRRVGGTLDLDPLEEVLSRASQRPLFLRLLANEALGFRPPPALLLRLKGESSVVDLKAHGISPIVSLARRYALEAGTSSRGTAARLERAVRAGLLPENVAVTITETYHFLLALRLRLQLRMAAEGRPVVNKVRLAELGEVERSRLKEAFRVIRNWQEKSGYQFHAEG